nr:Toll/interleukin-1 receptor (TIR) domain-containing protein [Tanacetum cinerariifolium]
MPVSCQKLKRINITYTNLRTFDLGLTPNLDIFSLFACTYFVELQVSAPCPNLKTLNLFRSSLRSLYLELIPNLERLYLTGCWELVDINAPAGCLEKVVELYLRGCALLEKLPEDIGRFGCLKELDITNTSITHLPQSIFGLKGLEIVTSEKFLQLYDFPSEITTTTSPLL